MIGSVPETEPGAFDQGNRDAPGADRAAKIILLGVITVLCAITWQKWGGLIVDTGREMYVPAALIHGKRLYFDLWYPYGPLIPYWHALLYWIFGVHVSVLTAVGIAIVAVISLTLYSVARFFLPVWLSFTVVFAFLCQAFQLDNCNYILPYSFPGAYSSMFAVILLSLLIRECYDERPSRMFFAGLLAGLMAITKIEFGVAAYGMLAVTLAIRAGRAKSIRKLARDAVLCAPGVLLFAAVYGWLVRQSSLSFVFDDNISILPSSYWVQSVGATWTRNRGLTGQPLALMRSLILSVAGMGAVLGAITLACHSRLARRTLLALALFICAAHGALVFAGKAFHLGVPTAILGVAPFLFFSPGMVWPSLLLAALVLPRWFRKGQRAPDSAVLILATACLALGGRVLTRFAPQGYPIFYDTIVYLGWVVALYRFSEYLPTRVPDRVWKGTALALCCGVVALTIVHYPVHKRTFRISTPRGTMYVQPALGKPYSGLLSFLQAATARSERFAVLPEETSLYYFAGAEVPSRWYILIPGVLRPGRPTADYIEDLNRAAIRYVVVSNRPFDDYGLTQFGLDCHQDIYRWIGQNFRVAAQFGPYERKNDWASWGAIVFERK
jgi:hypothetical protein